VTPTISPTVVFSTATPQACQQAGAVGDFEIDSEPLGRTLPGKIYLPPCYDPGLPGGYPVLYLLHGQSYDQSMWLDLGAAQIADRLIQSGQIDPMIMVMPREEYYLQDPAESQFRNALIESLIPWVDASYNTCSQRACRAIGGISRGAYWAIKLGLSDWQYFISAGAHSLPGGPYSYTKIKIYMNAMPPDQRTRLAVDIGSGDGYHKTAQQYVELLAKAGYPVDWHDPEGIHNPDYWQAHVEEYLRWYGQGWGKK
jgi:enterochelin esterase-like enzyme